MQNRVIKTSFILCALLLFSFMASDLFPQNTEEDETAQRGSIPEDLLRPRRDEAPRYPVDTVIGPLGQGSSPREAYELARRAVIALLAGNAEAPALSSANRTFIRDSIGQVQLIEPRQYRLGGGREEPDGSVSFMVRFIGREYSITGELYIGLHERRPEAPPEIAPVPVVELPETDENGEQLEDAVPEEAEQNMPQTAEEALASPAPEQVVQVPLAPVVRTWSIDDLVLEDPRSLGEENRETRQHFDFPPYERFF